MSPRPRPPAPLSLRRRRCCAFVSTRPAARLLGKEGATRNGAGALEGRAGLSL